MILTLTLLLIFLIIIVFACLHFTGEYMFYSEFVTGLALGFVYETEDFPEDNVKEHVIELLLWVVRFTFIWEVSNNNNNNTTNYAS